MNDTIVVLQSGLHDVALPNHGRRDAPLLTYRYHLRRLAAMIRRLRLRNPAATIVWKQTTHARPLLPPGGRSKAECDLYGYAQVSTPADRRGKLPFFWPPSCHLYMYALALLPLVSYVSADSLFASAYSLLLLRLCLHSLRPTLLTARLTARRPTRG